MRLELAVTLFDLCFMAVSAALCVARIAQTRCIGHSTARRPLPILGIDTCAAVRGQQRGPWHCGRFGGFGIPSPIVGAEMEWQSEDTTAPIAATAVRIRDEKGLSARVCTREALERWSTRTLEHWGMAAFGRLLAGTSSMHDRGDGKLPR